MITAFCSRKILIIEEALPKMFQCARESQSDYKNRFLYGGTKQVTMMLKVINYSVKEELFTLNTLHLDQGLHDFSLSNIYSDFGAYRAPLVGKGRMGRCSCIILRWQFVMRQ